MQNHVPETATTQMATIRAVQVAELGGLDRLQLVEVPVPEPGPGQVRIAMRAAGVNFPDLLVIAGRYQHRPELPFSPGSELAGVVTAVGPGVAGFAVGDRVAATPSHGAFAEEVIVEESACLPVPGGLDLVDAAVLPIAFGTAHHALRDRGALVAGETLLVLGATGGTGSAAVRLGVLMGARVIAAVGSPEKVDVARTIGADDVVVYGGDPPLREQVKALTAGAGADVVFDPVGGTVTAECLRCVAWGGRHLVIGFAEGTIPEIPANLLLLKGSAAVGVFWGRWRTEDPSAGAVQFAELAELVASGRLDTGISARYPLAEARAALQQLADRRAVGKVVLIGE